MNQQPTNKKLIAIIVIILGILSVIVTTVNMQVTIGDAEAFLAGQVAVPISGIITWPLNILQTFGFIYLVFAGNFKKTNLFWILILPVGCIVIGVRHFLRLNQSNTAEIS